MREADYRVPADAAFQRQPRWPIKLILECNLELISEQDFAELPEEDEQWFVALEAICRRNMNRSIHEDVSQAFYRGIQLQCMAAVAAIAEECSIPNIPQGPFLNDKSFTEESATFSLSVPGEVVRIRVRRRGIHHPYSVLLTSSTRTKIEHYISRPRNMINSSDLPVDRKKVLRDRLDQLTTDL